MKRRLGWIAMVLVGTAATAAEFSKQTIGTPGNWAGTIAGTVLDGTLYTVESSGTLYATDPADGSWTKLGGADFANTAFLFAAGGSLVSIEQDGSLYLIDPSNGTWKRSGEAGTWANTVAGAVLDGTLYTVESSGTLYATDPAAGTWRKVGNPDFAATKFLFAADNQLVSIESSGNLYLVDPADGSWEQVGEAGAWANVLAGATIGRTLHTAETDGSLCATDVAMGARVAAASGFAGTRFLFGIRGQLCGIDADGNFFRYGTGAPPVDAARIVAPAAASPAPSSEEDEALNDPARAGALTFQFMGQWTGDMAPLEQDPEFKKQKAAAPEMVQQIVDLMKGMKMTVTLDGVTMEVMGEKVGPFAYTMLAGHDNVLVIEMDEGPKQGTRSRITFRDPRHLQVEELTPEGRAMFFLKP